MSFRAFMQALGWSMLPIVLIVGAAIAQHLVEEYIRRKREETGNYEVNRSDGE